MHLLVLASLLASVTFAQPKNAAAPVLTKEQQELIKKLPGQKLSVDLVVAKAFASSDSADALRAQAYRIESPYHQSRITTDLKISAKAEYTKNEKDVLGIMDNRSSKLFNLNFSKYFFTGTSLTLDFNELQSELAPIIASFGMPASKSTAKVTLSQNLWKDFFGYQTRLNLDAGVAARDAANFEFKSNVQKWVVELVNLYYSVWYTKEQLKAAEANFTRSKRLLDIAKIKLNRGTAERPDFLHTESSYLEAKHRKDLAEQELQQTWRELVISLKLPTSWLSVPAALIPLELDQPYSKAIPLCMSATGAEQSKGRSLDVKFSQARLQAAEKSMKSADNAFSPDVKLYGSYGPEGVGGEFSDRWGDVGSGDQYGWSVGMSMLMPLGWHAEKADYMNKRADYETARAMGNKSESDHVTGWVNTCARLKILIENRESLRTSVKNQIARSNLEERRFRLGQIQTENVIRAGNEQTQSELFLNQSEIDLNRAAWDILKMNGDIEDYLTQTVKNYSGFKL